VASIVSTLEPGNPTNFTSQLVNHLPFSFVTPLRTEHHCGWHDGGALQTIHEPAHDVNPSSSINIDAKVR
jgi:hypothetical protein